MDDPGDYLTHTVILNAYCPWQTPGALPKYFFKDAFAQLPMLFCWKASCLISQVDIGIHPDVNPIISHSPAQLADMFCFLTARNLGAATSPWQPDACLPHYTHYYSFQPWIYISWFDNAAIKKDLLSPPESKPFVGALHFFPFFCSFDSVIHNLLFIPVFCITNGLRIKDKSGFCKLSGGKWIPEQYVSTEKLVEERGAARERGPKDACVAREEISLFHLRQTQFHINE